MPKIIIIITKRTILMITLIVTMMVKAISIAKNTQSWSHNCFSSFRVVFSNTSLSMQQKRFVLFFEQKKNRSFLSL